MATNLLPNGNFETGVLDPLLDWDVTLGSFTVVADTDSPFGGQYALNVPAEVDVLANNFGPAVTQGDKLYTNMHIELVSGTGSLAITSGSGANQDVRLVVYSDGRVEYRAPNDAAIVLRRLFFEVPTTRFVLDFPWEASATSSFSSLGLVQDASLLFSNVDPAFQSNAQWIVDDVWLSTVPQPNKVLRPDNGPGPRIFQVSEYDDIHGTLHKRKDIKLDKDSRIRTINDMEAYDRDDFAYSSSRRSDREP